MTHPTRACQLLLASSALLMLPMLAGCGGSYSAATPATTAAATTPVASTTTSSSTAGSSSSRVTAAESEYKIVLSSTTLKPGTYTFVAVNKGTIPHTLAISGPGVPGTQTAGTIAPGASQTLTVALTKGTYDVHCTVSGHKALGMDTKVTVQ